MFFRKLLTDLIELLKFAHLPKCTDLLEKARRQLHTLQYNVFVTKKAERAASKQSIRKGTTQRHHLHIEPTGVSAIYTGHQKTYVWQ